MSIILRHLPLLGNKKIFFKDLDLFEISLRKMMTLSSVFSRGKEFGFDRYQLANSNGLITGERLHTEEQMHVLAASTEQPSFAPKSSICTLCFWRKPVFPNPHLCLLWWSMSPSYLFFCCCCSGSPNALSRSLPSAPFPRSKWTRIQRNNNNSKWLRTVN